MSDFIPRYGLFSHQVKRDILMLPRNTRFSEN